MNVIVVLSFIVAMSVVNANPVTKEDLCSGMFKDLAICKIRGLTEQAVKETEQILSEYYEILSRGNFFEKMDQNPTAVNNQKIPFEKRKSAFVRFGKRSEENSNLNSESPRSADLPNLPWFLSMNFYSNGPRSGSNENHPEISEIEKRKSSYVRFGKREM